MAAGALTAADPEPDVLGLEFNLSVDAGAVTVFPDGRMEPVEQNVTVQLAGDQLKSFYKRGYADVEISLSDNVTMHTRLWRDERRELKGWLVAGRRFGKPADKGGCGFLFRLRPARSRTQRRRNIRSGRAKARAPGSRDSDDPDPEHVGASSPGGPR